MHTFVLFGASGDLAKEKLYPALFDLFRASEIFRVVGFARTPLTTQDFQKLVADSLRRRRKKPTTTELKKFLAHFSYVSGTYDTEGIAALRSALKIDRPIAFPLSYYLAIPVEYPLIRSIILGLSANQLIVGQSAIGIEKPFGFDGQSATQLNRLLAKYFTEDQIYRIDHYLAKGMVQDLFALRFANPIFEPIWNNRYIEKISIDICEEDSIRNRGQYYERAGAIRDILQNHALQLLAFTTMATPRDLNAASIHREKIKILRRLRLFGDNGLENISIRQYHGYQNEKFVAPDSIVETAASLRLEIDTPQWRGVPITIATGKKIAKRTTDILIHFKKKQLYLWDKTECDLQENLFYINIQPENDIRLRLNSEFNFKDLCALPVDLRFGFLDNQYLFMDPYENALRDFFHRNQSIFLNATEIALSWKLIDHILALIAPRRQLLLETY